MHRIVASTAALALAISIVAAGPVVASSASVVRADLEGASLAVDEIPDFFCHDRAYPQIHCFRTAARLEAAVAETGSGGTTTATGTGDYVVIFASPAYSGSYMYVSQNYDALAVIGWNDRIRSYRALNSAHGTFWTDWYAGGSHLDFCCNYGEASLNATFDLAISSVYRR